MPVACKQGEMTIFGCDHSTCSRNHPHGIITEYISFSAGCVNLGPYDKPTLKSVCKQLSPESQIITLFAENYTPINCRSSLEGVFHFAYQVRYFSKADARHNNVVDARFLEVRVPTGIIRGPSALKRMCRHLHVGRD